MTLETIDHLTDEQVKDLHRLYQAEWWTQGRKLPDVERMLQHCDVIIAYCDSETKQLVAFARVLTDYVYKALIFDVIVEASYRNRGLGRTLMEAILSHSSLKSVQHFELYGLPEMIPFYDKWGFTAELGQLRFMRRSN